MKARLIAAIATFAAIACAPNLAAATPDAKPAIQSAKPAKPDAIRAKEIADLKWGLFVCWSFSTVSGKEWTPEPQGPEFFTVTGCDTDQWAQAAKDAGMGYILILAKHHDGFCLWDTKTTNLNVMNSPLKRDVLAEMRKSCDKHGLKLAIYFSEGDWTWPGSKRGGKSGPNPEVLKAQLKELLTHYGPIEFLWIDHATKTGGLTHQEFDAYVRTLQPDCFTGFNHGEAAGRISLREMGTPGKLGEGNALAGQIANEKKHAYSLVEFTYPMLPGHWFYAEAARNTPGIPAEKLYQHYKGAMANGNIFSLDIGPDQAGKLRERDVATLREVGRTIRGEK